MCTLLNQKTSMPYFNQEFIAFFKQLEKNNRKEWFDQNRKTYEKEVKAPFAEFVDEMITRIQKHEPEAEITGKDAIFRINKDIRFSKDKTPYKTNVSANISKYGRKDKAYPGFYFELSHRAIRIFGGAYRTTTPVLDQLRAHIASDLKTFQNVYTDKAFTEKFGKIQGEQHKRLSKNIQKVAEKEPLIANKQFYYTAELDASLVLNEELPDRLMEYYLAAKPLNMLLRKAF